MQAKNTGYKLLLGGVTLTALMAAVCLYFAQTVGYDLSIRHFARNSPFAWGTVCAIAVALVCGIIAGILRKKAPKTPPVLRTSAFGIFAAAVTAFMLLASVVLSLLNRSAVISVLSIARLISMVLTAAFFFLIAARERKTDGATALLSLCPLLFSLLSILTMYFDTDYPMNAPIKTYWLLTYIAMTLFFTEEARMILSRSRSFWHTLTGTFCLTMTSAVGLSQLAISLHDTVGHGFSLIDSALFVCIALYTGTRLFACGAPSNTAKPAEDTDESHG